MAYKNDMVQFAIRVEKNIGDPFKKWCSDNGISQTRAISLLMKTVINHNSNIKIEIGRPKENQNV